MPGIVKNEKSGHRARAAPGTRPGENHADFSFDRMDGVENP